MKINYKRLVGRIAIRLYSLLIIICSLLLRAAKFFMPTVRSFLNGRELDLVELANLRRDGAQEYKTIVFFVSSAGEFEQAKPLIDRWLLMPKYRIHVVFFSESGIKYVKARKETISYSKAPLDTVCNWRAFFRALQPCCCIVVKYELWPAFLYVAAEVCPLVLIDGMRSPRLERSSFARWVRGKFLRYFNPIFVVDDKDKEFFIGRLGLDSNKIHVVGDTKYDRVVERSRLLIKEATVLHDQMDGSFGKKHRLIVGSGWHRDIEFLLNTYRKLFDELIRKSWQLVLVPHRIDQEMIAWIVNECKSRGLDHCLYSDWEKDRSAINQAVQKILIVDKMGLLAELYSCGQAAFVGGGLHHQVHNVLEPAVRGLFVGFGPLYHNSKEAELLVNGELAAVIHDEDEMLVWWQKLLASSGSLDDKLLQRVKELCGAADRVVTHLALDSGCKGGNSDL